MASMTEVEVTLRVPEASIREVEHVVRTGETRRIRLRAICFDTPDGRLSKSGISWCLTKEGRLWRQTLSVGGLSAVPILEDDVALHGVLAATPQIDPQQHVGTPGAGLLEVAMAPRNGEAVPQMTERYRTDVWRCRRALRAPGATVELVFDHGEIVAGERRMPVCELKIGILRGKPGAVIDVARRWAARHHLWLDARSKAERGDSLANGTASVPCARANSVDVQRATPVEKALQAVVANCLDQVVHNASQIAEGIYEAEHVHQLRVGLRRLRTALRFFEDRTASIDRSWTGEA